MGFAALIRIREGVSSSRAIRQSRGADVVVLAKEALLWKH